MSIDNTIHRLNLIKQGFANGDRTMCEEDMQVIEGAVDYLRDYANMIIDIWSKVGTAKEEKNEHIR